MTARRRARVPYGAERALLSDVMPYELPISFNNSGFVRLLAKLDLRIEDKQVEATWIGPSTPVLLSLLFGEAVRVSKPRTGKRVKFSTTKGASPRTHPLTYDIGKSTGGIRSIALMHPRSQIEVVNFYRRYASSILYYTRRSHFSIRHPVGIARFTVFRDPVFAEDRDPSSIGVEEAGRACERLRSYFVYGGYSHIYKFHDSAEFRLLERRYSRLVRLDVTRCFDSIYTHSISWVTNGVEQSKVLTGQCDATFGGKFDRLMRASNDLETHGILIGPEVSRIFAEIILQEVDLRVEWRLSRNGYRHRVDYEIRRFVDDYFVFCNSDSSAAVIVSALADELKDFKLYLNEAKRSDELTPLRSPRSAAKFQLRSAVLTGVQCKKVEGDSPLPILVASAEHLLLSYKSILLATGLDHGDLANYTLVLLEGAFERALATWRGCVMMDGAPKPTEQLWAGVAKFLSTVLDVAVSIYVGSVSASHGVKIARIAHTALSFMADVDMPYVLRSSVRSKIASEIQAHIRRDANESASPIHALILLDCLSAMEDFGGLSDTELRELLNLHEGGPEPNAIAILTVLRYCADKPSLAGIRGDLENLSIAVIHGKRAPLDSNATLLAAALLSSPFQPKELKCKVLAQLGLERASIPTLDQANLPFFSWEIPDYYAALQRKRGGAVYVRPRPAAAPFRGTHRRIGEGRANSMRVLRAADVLLPQHAALGAAPALVRSSSRLGFEISFVRERVALLS